MDKAQETKGTHETEKRKRERGVLGEVVAKDDKTKWKGRRCRRKGV